MRLRPLSSKLTHLSSYFENDERKETESRFALMDKILIATNFTGVSSSSSPLINCSTITLSDTTTKGDYTIESTSRNLAAIALTLANNPPSCCNENTPMISKRPTNTTLTF